jgi:hypothetical protein
MTVLERIAYYQDRRDEVPNQELARDLAQNKDQAGIQEIAAQLWNKNKSVRSDCLKVLYEIGYIDPVLIADYADDFLRLLQDRQNRMVWGAMIGLATIAPLRPEKIGAALDDVLAAVEKGSVITVVWGIRTLSIVATADSSDRERIWPFLMQHLQRCGPRHVPVHAEDIARAVDSSNKDEFLSVLASRQAELSATQASRLKKVLRAVEGR